MYVEPNFRSKKALKDAVKAGRIVTVFQPGPWGDTVDVSQAREVTVEGPHYPEPHRWYARVAIVDGRVARVIQ